jgi:hypothetical protein
MTEERCTDCMVGQGRKCHCRQFRPKLFWPILLGLLSWYLIVIVLLQVANYL